MKITLVIEDTTTGVGVSCKIVPGEKNPAGYTESLAYMIAQQVYFQVLRPAINNKSMRVKEVPFPTDLGLPPKALN